MLAIRAPSSNSTRLTREMSTDEKHTPRTDSSLSPTTEQMESVPSRLRGANSIDTSELNQSSASQGPVDEISKMADALNVWRMQVESELVKWQTQTRDWLRSIVDAAGGDGGVLDQGAKPKPKGKPRVTGTLSGVQKTNTTKRKRGATDQDSMPPPKPPTAKQLALREMNAKYGIGKIPEDCEEWKQYCQKFGPPKRRKRKETPPASVQET